MNRDASYKGTASLFKYRPLDEHTYEIENLKTLLKLAKVIDHVCQPPMTLKSRWSNSPYKVKSVQRILYVGTIFND